MHSAKQLKEILYPKLNKYDDILKACSKLRHSLDTSKLYLENNSKNMDPTIYGLIYKQIANHTSSTLPNSCKIYKPLDCSIYDRDMSILDYIESSDYIIYNLSIDKSVKNKPLIVNRVESTVVSTNKNLHNTLIEYKPSKIEHTKKHEEKVIKNTLYAFRMSFNGVLLSFVLGVACLCFGVSALGVILLGISALLIFMVLGLILDYANYKRSHEIYKCSISEKKANINDFYDIISDLLQNVNSLEKKTKSEKSDAIDDFKDGLKVLKTYYQSKTSPVKHLKQIKSNGKDWSTLSKKATKLEEQHAYV